NDQDRLDYLQLLRLQGDNNGLHFVSYALMDNHVHLVAIPDEEDSLRRAVGEAHRRYTLGVNRRLEKKGYLFQGRPFSCPMDDDYFRRTLRYVERNPVRAKMVALAWEYVWSSARFHAGFATTDPLVDFDCHSYFGLDKRQWRDFLQADPIGMELLQKRTRTGRPCGCKSFIDKLESITGRVLHLRQPGRRKPDRKNIVSPYSSYG
ncbi:MAG: transposase, partial [Acidobacteriota bacterium]